MTRAMLGWIAAALAMSGAAARADGPPAPLPAARPHVDAGVAAYDAGDYTAAVRAFSAAYEIDPQPAVLYAWAQSLRLGNRCSDAIAMYRRYLALALTEAQTAAAQHGLSLCERALAAEPAPPVPPVPGRPEPGPAGDVGRPRRWYADPAGGALVLGGAVSIAAGAGFLVASGRSRDRAAGVVFREDFVELLDTATQQRRIGAVGLGLGAALVTGGVLRYMARREPPRAVAIGVTGRGLVVRGRF